MPRPKRWRIPIAVLGSAANRELARAARPTELDRAYLKEALGRRKSRSHAKAVRAAGLYALSRETGPAPEHQARARLQDVQAHDWDKAWATPGLPPYGVEQDADKDNIGDVQDGMK